MAQIAFARASDHAGEVVVQAQDDFDIDKTIFAALQSPISRSFTASRVGIKLFWSDVACRRIQSAFQRVPRAPAHDRALLSFMEEECDFAVEHADGTFLDHLRFCYEYSHAHFPNRSARVLLLHSILGVGTNIFPMEAAKIPQLQALVSPFEFAQVAMFPTVLRLLYHGPLLDQLTKCPKEKLGRLAGVVCWRVIDNARIEMDAEAFWSQLNYQLIHLLDFLPAASWKRHMDDNFLHDFISLHALLTRAGKLWCQVDYNAKEAAGTSAGQPRTLITMLRGAIPSSIALMLVRRNIAQFSAEIGHRLEYQLHFRESPVPKPTSRL